MSSAPLAFRISGLVCPLVGYQSQIVPFFGSFCQSSTSSFVTFLPMLFHFGIYDCFPLDLVLSIGMLPSSIYWKAKSSKNQLSLNFIFHDSFWKSRVFFYFLSPWWIFRGRRVKEAALGKFCCSRKLNPIQQNLWSRAFELLLTFNLKLAEKLPKSRYYYRSCAITTREPSTLTLDSIWKTFQGQKAKILSLSSYSMSQIFADQHDDQHDDYQTNGNG